MKKIWIMFLLAMVNTSAKAQNLVPNASLEDTVQCPDNASQIDRAVGWSSYSISPDYYNSCCINPLFGVPNNYYGGYQLPATGNAYAGFECFATNVFFRECLGAQLSQPLVVGEKYFASCKISRGVGAGGQLNIATNKLGIRFSTVPYSYLNPVPIDNIAQVYTDSIISDTVNWVTISGCFIADSSYQYVCFGNFFDDTHTNYINYGGINSSGAYYFIDDVLVAEADSTICPGNTGITDVPSPTIEMFPNPINNVLFIENNLNDVFEMMMYNEIGNLIKRLKINKGIIRVDLSYYAEGVYFINLKSASESLRQKIIKINN